MKKRLSSLVAVLVCALALSGEQGPVLGEGGLAPEAALGSLRARPQRLASAPGAPGTPDIRSGARAKGSPVVPVDAGVSRADRLAAEEAQLAEARDNRARLLFRNVADLQAAAERAEQEGKPEYAAALRHRAEILGQSVKME